MEHVYVQEPEKLQIAITHRLSATELNPDWTVLTSSSAPSTGSVQYNTASVGGSDVVVKFSQQQRPCLMAVASQVLQQPMMEPVEQRTFSR